MAAPVPYFELHIRPMFRLIDRDHMLRLGEARRIDLWDYDQVKAKAARIFNVLKQPARFAMPTKDFGGPWPEGWLKTFDDWVKAGCPRLSVTRGNYELRRLADGSTRLSVSVKLDNGADDGWVDRLQTTSDIAEFKVYLRPAAAGETAGPRVHTMNETLNDQIATVYIIDADGRKELPFVA